MKEIYLAGGCYWGVQKYCDNIRGVISTEVGFANGRVDNPYYALVKKGDTGFAETVRVVYGDTLPLRALLRLFFPHDRKTLKRLRVLKRWAVMKWHGRKRRK